MKIENVMFSFKSNEHNQQPIILNIPERKGLAWRIARKCWLKLPFFMKRRLGKLKEYLKAKL